MIENCRSGISGTGVRRNCCLCAVCVLDCGMGSFMSAINFACFSGSCSRGAKAFWGGGFWGKESMGGEVREGGRASAHILV